jgi:hypothetical protein
MPEVKLATPQLKCNSIYPIVIASLTSSVGVAVRDTIAQG